MNTSQAKEEGHKSRKTSMAFLGHLLVSVCIVQKSLPSKKGKK
jgi:hypothetical protein